MYVDITLAVCLTLGSKNGTIVRLRFLYYNRKNAVLWKIEFVIAI